MDIVRGSAKNRYRRSRSSASPDPACPISRTATPSLAPAVHSPFCSARNTPRYNYQLRRYLSAAISVSGTVSTHSTRLRLLSAPTLFPRSSTYRCSAVARMAFRWIVNAGLIAIPIGSTLGVLFGIDASRHASGQAPLFSGGDGNNGNGSSGGTGGNGGSGGNNTPPDSTGGGDGGDHSNHTELGITVSTYCSLTYGILPPAAGGLNYSLNPNQWGVLALDGPNAPSGLCMNVTTFNNQTYATNTSAPEWSVTWKYTPGPETQPVHAYPNIQVLDGLPLTLSDVKAVNFDMAWTYNLGNETKPTSDTPEFDSISLNTNVAIDMFFDSNKTKAIDSTLAAYEIMVWFAHYGNAAQTIGNASGIVETKVINQTTFDLYYGSHVVGGKDQNVFTWVASENVESFTGDISPLITELTSKSGTQYPKESDYMGSFGFGSEAYNADQWVTFNVPHLQVDIQT